MLRLLEYIDAHLDEELTAPRLAAVAHLSPSRLAHLFTAQTGTRCAATSRRNGWRPPRGCWR